MYGLEEDGKWSPVAFKMSNPFWEGCGVLKRAVPHGHNAQGDISFYEIGLFSNRVLLGIE